MTSGTTCSPWGMLTHVGRSSGRTYRTLLPTCTYGDGFLVPLRNGTRTGWYQNVMAAGACEFFWQEDSHRLERPEMIREAEAMDAWPTYDWALLQLSAENNFAWLHEVKVTDPSGECVILAW